MKDIEGDSKSILALFEKEEKRIIAETRQQEVEALKELKKADAAHGEISVKLVETEKTLTRLRAGYLALEKRVKAECDTAVELASVTPDQVRRGEKNLVDFYHTGKSESGIRKEKAEAAATELADALRMVRQSQIETWELQRQKAELEANIAYLVGAPARSQMTRLKAHVVSLEQRLGPVILQQRTGSDEAIRLKEMLDFASGKSLTVGRNFDSLTIEGCRLLIFNPLLRSDYLEQYQTETLPSIEANEQKRIADGQGASLYMIMLSTGGWNTSSKGAGWMERSATPGILAMAATSPMNRSDGLSMSELKKPEDDSAREVKDADIVGS